MLFSVVIAAHDRPGFLREAVDSVAQQTYGDFEIVVVDDGSQPPLASDPLRSVVRDRLVFLRHERALGVSGARNAGIRSARGDVVLLLDDDDLLMPTALQTIEAALTEHPTLDCVFMGVEPFGPYADGAARNRRQAMRQLLERVQPDERDGLLFFGEHLFDELVGRVPIDFQRPAARRAVWDRVGGFDEGALFAEPSWAVRAVATCTVALTVNPLTRWRIHGSNFGWPPGMTTRQIVGRNLRNALLMAEGLEREFRLGQDDREHGRYRAIVSHLAAQHLAMARYLREDGVGAGLPNIIQSLRLDARPANWRAALPYFLPRRWLNRIRRLRR